MTRYLRIAVALAGLLFTQATLASGPRFSSNGGIASNNATYTNGEVTGGTYSINGTTGVANFASITTGTMSIDSSIVSDNPAIQIGPSRIPFAWSPYTTTGSTTSGSNILGISSSVIAQFRTGDHITVSTCPSCNVIVSGGGTTTLTLDGNATSTTSSASVTVGVQRYDTISSIVATTGGFDTILVGSAARGYGDWSGSVDGPGIYPNINTLSVISPNGGRAATLSSRLSDKAINSGLPYMENVVHYALLDTIPTGTQGGGWNLYQESSLLTAAQPTVTGLGFIGEENSVYNEWISPQLDPFQTNITAYSENLRPDCGSGHGIPQSCSDAIHIINNGGTYKSGIVFSSDALDTSSGTGAPAVAMGPQQALTWYRSASTPSWKIYSTSDNTGSVGHFIRLRDNGAGNGDIYTYESSFSLEGASGSINRVIRYKSGDHDLWDVGVTNIAQSGSNSGADYAISRFSDTGTLIDIPLQINRSSGITQMNIASLKVLTYATLPICGSTTNGSIAYISDASSPAYNAVMTVGGGTTKTLVLCNGTNWTAH